MKLPDNEEVNSGHVTAVCFRGLWAIAFDFRRNLDRVRRRLDLAEKYFNAAMLSAGKGLTEPALESLWAAAELAVVAELGTLHEDVLLPARGAHRRRQKNFSGWVRLGNAPSGADQVLASLAAGRRVHRYGEQSSPPIPEEVEAAFSKVRELIDHARSRSADLTAG